MREDLIAAALHLFSEGGNEGVSMRAVASAVGVSAMAPYRYFADKNELLGGLWHHVLADVYQRIAAAVSGAVGARQRERAANEALLDYWETHPDEYRLVHQTQGTVQKKEEIATVYASIMELYRGLTSELASEIGVDMTHAVLADEVRMVMGLGYMSALSNRRYPWHDLRALRAVYIGQMLLSVEHCLRHGPSGNASQEPARKPRKRVGSQGSLRG